MVRSFDLEELRPRFLVKTTLIFNLELSLPTYLAKTYA
jgi:hypothetical protein